MSRMFSETGWRDLRRHLGGVGLATLTAIAPSAVAFVAVGAVRFAFDDRSFWDSQRSSLSRLWYLALAFLIVSAVPMFVLVRRGWDAAAAFVIDQGYWKVLVAVYLVVPVLVGVALFVVGNLVAVLVVAAVLLILFAVVGGF